LGNEDHVGVESGRLVDDGVEPPAIGFDRGPEIRQGVSQSCRGLAMAPPRHEVVPGRVLEVRFQARPASDHELQLPQPSPDLRPLIGRARPVAPGKVLERQLHELQAAIGFGERIRTVVRVVRQSIRQVVDAHEDDDGVNPGILRQQVSDRQLMMRRSGATLAGVPHPHLLSAEPLVQCGLEQVGPGE